MRIGFTGTQWGMTRQQDIRLKRILLDFATFWTDDDEFHHGDCIGADAQAHDIAKSLGYDITIHPPISPLKRANKKAKHIRELLPYLDRNKVIVNETEVLIAVPAQKEEQLRSGTWSTVRYARKKKRRIHVIFPDGEISHE